MSNLKLLFEEMPTDMSAISVDMEHPNRCLIHGCFRQHVSTQSGERDFVTYIPQELDNCSQCLIVAPPSNEDPLEFMETSGLRQLADEKRLFLFMLIAENKYWKPDGTDADYMNAVYISVQNRRFYVAMQDNVYACGIGNGADIAFQAVQKTSGNWSGLFTIGDMRSELLTEPERKIKSRDQGNLELYVEEGRCQVPVWMAVSEITNINAAAINYWKEQNQVTEMPLSGQGADFIWMPTPVRMKNEVNEEVISQVRVTLGNVQCSLSLLNTMWNYIGMARRHRSYGRKALRYYKDVKEYQAEKHVLVVNGMTRIWYEYVPETCTEDKAWPMVVVMHGRGGSAETFFDISGMANVARDRKFIAVFPEAGIYQQRAGGLRNVLLWNGAYEDEAIDDVTFIREMVEDIESRRKIDKSRIYACGQSSGGMMTDSLAEYASDIFAAAASWSGLMIQEISTNCKHTNNCIPTMFLFGDKDLMCHGKEDISDLPFRLSKDCYNIFMKKIERYHLDLKDVQTWTSYPITWFSYPNKQGVPMVTIGIVDNMVHANYPEESWISYDQFFCQFSRNENGKLCYRNTIIID